MIVNANQRCIVLLLSMLTFGCGGAEPADLPKVALFPFGGVVKVNGKPISGAQVTLHPSNDSTLGIVNPNGITDESGLFTLTTYQPADGAPEGKYLVTVSWAEVKNANSSDPEYGPEKLPRRYQDKALSGLSLEVTADSTEPPTLELALR